MDPAAFRVGDEIDLAANTYFAREGRYTLILFDERAAAEGDKMLWKGIHKETGDEFWFAEEHMFHA